MARAGLASRRAAEEMIRQGRVMVNHVPVGKPGTLADPAKDTITVDGVGLKKSRTPMVFAYYKPRGILSTMKDPKGRDCLDKVARRLAPRERLYPVGRLDAQSEGLLLMTNDGDLAQKIAHPSGEVSKTYRVQVEGELGASVLDRLRKGAVVEGKRVKPVKVWADRKPRQGGLLSLIIAEGRRHEVRIMCRGAGLRVRRLKRVALGSLSLGGLKPGRARRLGPADLKKVFRPPHHRKGPRSYPRGLAGRPS